MINLNTTPAFGFETETYKAGEYYRKDFQKRMAKLPHLDLTEKTDDPEYQNSKILQENIYIENARKVCNFVKIVGYIPFFGTFAGILRINSALKATEEELPNKFNHIARGCIEMTSLGCLLLIHDLILTLWRNRPRNDISVDHFVKV